MRPFGLGRPQSESAHEQPVLLTPRDLSRLSLSWSSSFSMRDLELHLLDNPNLSYWIPGSNEYLIGGAWRHRDEIVVVQELAARLRSEELVGELINACRQHGQRLVVMLDQFEGRRDSYYQRLDFELIQQIIIYELTRIPHPIPTPRRLRFVPATPENRADLLQVDHDAFPWLWWNSDAEFNNYAALFGVEIFLVYEHDGTPVGYVGITSFRGWGHLDRIAVIPSRQGSGYGLETLNFAVAYLRDLGARRIGLSTQADNIRSQHLYERYGFHRTTGGDYTIYGTWLKEDYDR